MIKFVAVLALSAAVITPASAAELLINGNFETGDYTGWTPNVLAPSNGNLFISAPGSNSPLSGNATANNSFGGGNFYSVTDQGGPGTYALVQSFLVPNAVTSLILTFQLFANNQAGVTIIDPIGLNHTGPANQHARVDILTAGANPFSTAAGDVIANLYIGADGVSGANPYIQYNFNLLSLGLVGGTGYQIRFAETDNQFFFQTGVDNVSVDALAGGVPEPAAWAMMLAGFGLVGAAIRRRPKLRLSYS